MQLRDRQITHRVAMVGMHGNVVDDGSRLGTFCFIVRPRKHHLGRRVGVGILIRVRHGGGNMHDIPVGEVEQVGILLIGGKRLIINKIVVIRITVWPIIPHVARIGAMGEHGFILHRLWRKEEFEVVKMVLSTDLDVEVDGDFRVGADTEQFFGAHRGPTPVPAISRCGSIVRDKQSILGIGGSIHLSDHPIVVAAPVVELPPPVCHRREIRVIGYLFDAQRRGECHRLISRFRANGRDLHLIVFALLKVVKDVIGVVRGVVENPGGVGQMAVADDIAVLRKAHPGDGGGVSRDAVGLHIIDRRTLRAVEQRNIVDEDAAPARRDIKTEKGKLDKP